MFIAAKRSVARPPSGGPCQPTMCERGTSNNGFLTWGGISSQPVYKHSPPDGGPNHQSSTSVKRCACHASHFLITPGGQLRNRQRNHRASADGASTST